MADNVIAEKGTGRCINCHQQVETPFCPNCGQPFPPQRISVAQMFSDFLGRTHGTNGLFLRTLRDLTTRPGEVARTYIMGNRVLYNRPVGYFFLMITIMLILVSLLNIDYKEFMIGIAPTDAPVKQSKLNDSIFNFMTNNLKIISFIVIPFQAFVARYLFYRKSNYSYLDHTVVPLYLGGHLNILVIIGLVLFKIISVSISFSLISIVTLGYFAFTYAGLMKHQSLVKGIFKGIGIYIVTQLLLIILAGIGGFAYLYTHQDLLKELSK